MDEATKVFFSSKTDLGKAPQGNLKSLALELSVRVRGREREAETGGINTILLQEYFESSLNRSLTSFFLGNISPLTIGAAGMMAHLYSSVLAALFPLSDHLDPQVAPGLFVYVVGDGYGRGDFAEIG